MNTQGSANLEKAYEDLEREIRDIKSKLQRSMGGAGASGPAINANGPAEALTMSQAYNQQRA